MPRLHQTPEILRDVLHAPQHAPLPRTQLHSYAHQARFVHYYNRYMLLVALLGPIYFYMQAGSMVERPNSEEQQSLVWYLFAVIIALSWLVYGLVRSDSIVVFASVVLLLGALVVLLLIVAYSRNKIPHAFL
jgi:uncharacterized protein with PQ loop repeat